MTIVKRYGNIKVYNVNGHYEIYINNNFEVSCDDRKEVEEELRRINQEGGEE